MTSTVGGPLPVQVAQEDEPFLYVIPASAFGNLNASDVVAWAIAGLDGKPLPSWIQFDPSTHTLFGVPTNGDVGAIDFKVTLTRTSLPALSYEFRLSILNTNDAPHLDYAIPDQSNIAGRFFELSPPLSTFGDVDVGDTLVYAATQSNGSPLPAWLHLDPNSGVFSGTPRIGDLGATTVIFRATDGSNVSASDTFQIKVVDYVKAAYAAFKPTGLIASGLFNFDAFGIDNFMLTGAVNVSVSDAFTRAQFLTYQGVLSTDVYTTLESGRNAWTAEQLSNINAITRTYSGFIDLTFGNVTDYSGQTPAGVGSLSDINISLIYQKDADFSGISALGSDAQFGYKGSRGDIVLNVDGLGGGGLQNDLSLDSSTYGFHTLMHEIGHSLGLTHPHLVYGENGVPSTLTSDFSALVAAGFDALGFQIHQAADMNKEYFSIMSYDEQRAANQYDTFAQTPMILDVIALQEVYGEGAGSSGSTDDVIRPGGDGGVVAYRTYFDKGGTDTIDLTNYSSGAYLHMGASIVGASHGVGVSMGMPDASAMFASQGDPQSLRWFYGEFENALGSGAGDDIIGNALNNTIAGNAGNDTIDGGAGIDTVNYNAERAGYVVTKTAGGQSVSDNTVGASSTDGVDSLKNVETLRFTDMSVDLTMAQKATTISAADLKILQELYVGFFNRVPEAAGLAYWIGEHARGVSLNAIADQFYGAGVQFNLYSASMTNDQFITTVYANVLGRTGPTAPPQSDINYWANRLVGGQDTKGTMVLTMLHDSHAFFTGDPTYGWVVNLLDNKATVANYFAIEQGLSYNVQQDNITKGIEIAAQITPTDTAQAIALIGV